MRTRGRGPVASEAAHPLGHDAHWLSVLRREFLGGSEDFLDAVPVLLHVGTVLVGGRLVRRAARHPREDDDVAVMPIAVEVQRDAGGAPDVLQTLGAPSAIDEEACAVPEEPNRIGLGRPVRRRRRQPDHPLLAQAPRHPRAKRRRRIGQHGTHGCRCTHGNLHRSLSYHLLPCTSAGRPYRSAACASTAEAKSGCTLSCASMLLRSTVQLNSLILPSSTYQTSAPGMSSWAPVSWMTPAGVSTGPVKVYWIDSSTATRFPMACTRWSSRCTSGARLPRETTVSPRCSPR